LEHKRDQLWIRNYGSPNSACTKGSWRWKIDEWWWLRAGENSRNVLRPKTRAGIYLYIGILLI
jgi:hypothetical protein